MHFKLTTLCTSLLIAFATIASAADKTEQYQKEIKPLLQKHCAACHNADDEESGLSVDSFASLVKGGENGVAIIPGEGKASLLGKVITANDDTIMPPADEGKMTQLEIKTILDWIDAGAHGPEGEEPRYTSLTVPDIKPLHSKKPPVTDVEWSPSGNVIAVARFQTVELLKSDGKTFIRKLPEHEGKVNRIAFSDDGQWLATASGIVGLTGTVNVFSVETGEELHSFSAHRDIIYGLAISHDKKQIATSSYDRSILVHDLVSGKVVSELSGHNGAVYDIDFSSDSKSIVSASGDETLKVWSAKSGKRLDTLGQPLEEQFVARFSPNDRFIAGAGRDNRIRVWRFVSKDLAKINPLRTARFAHEQPIVDLAFSHDSKLLVSISEDRSIKVWGMPRCNVLQAITDQPAICTSVSINPDASNIVVGRLDGSVEVLPINIAPSDSSKQSREIEIVRGADEKESHAVKESEPNGIPKAAQKVNIPAKISGVIHSVDASENADEDMYRFAAKAGEQFVLETNAARQKSPVDTHIEVLHEDGSPVTRVVLRAVRDSYFTFRGKDSNTSDDFRVHNWREMELNQFLFANGEVVKLWHYPRGPDSGFRVYPGTGNRWSYFDTTALTHALQAPCFIVEPVAPDAKTTANGLPTFTINYENDDESKRRLGKDSRLLFTAPKSGQYIARVRDVRGFEGDDYKYDLTVRHAAPDFSVTFFDLRRSETKDKDGKMVKAPAKLPKRSPREFRVTADRTDGFEGPIEVNITGMPAGIHITTPLLIEAEQVEAKGVFFADESAESPPAEAFKDIKITATAMIDGEEKTHEVGTIGEIELINNPRVIVRIAGAKETSEVAMKTNFDKPFVLTIKPGETVSAKVFADRREFKGVIEFGKDESGRNMPHGVFVDNIGLNGLVIMPEQTEREFFVTAADWVEPQERLFYLRANNASGECTLPVLLKVIADE